VLDRREELALLPLADERARLLLAGVSEARRTECWWLVLPDGTLIPGDRGGGLALLTRMRLTRPLGRLLHRLRTAPLVDAVDRRFARYRKRLGRVVPDGDAPTRFP
jgi:hypothetical protein